VASDGLLRHRKKIYFLGLCRITCYERFFEPVKIEVYVFLTLHVTKIIRKGSVNRVLELYNFYDKEV
jgi:hypothetical protein